MSIVKHIPNTITSLNLLSGVTGVIFTLGGNPAVGFFCMLAAAVFDFCDGLAARMLRVSSPIGKELDSLSDVVSFGVLPALMLYSVIDCTPAWPRYIPLLLAAFSAVRLAKFNVDDRQETDFLGLPTPASALIAGSLSHYISTCGGDAFPQFAAGSPWLLPALSLVLCALVVSELPMFGLKIKKGHKLMDTKRVVFLSLALVSVVISLVFGLVWSLPVLFILLIYVLENIVVALLSK